MHQRYFFSEFIEFHKFPKGSQHYMYNYNLNKQAYAKHFAEILPVHFEQVYNKPSDM